MTSPGVVYVDEDTGLYDNLRLPANWRIHKEPAWGSLGASMGWAYRTFPHASSYGWLADDTVPRTNGWDKNLEQAAGDWCLSHANDLWLASNPFNLGELQEGDNLSSGLCWGGKLVRSAGWWALPGLVQAGIDTAWCAIVGPLDLIRYQGEVVVEHKHYSTGKRPRDAGDSWVRDGDEYIKADLVFRNDWVWSERFRDTVTRIGEAADLLPTERRLRRLQRAYKDSAADQHWFKGCPQARITRAWNETEVPVALHHLVPHATQTRVS